MPSDNSAALQKENQQLKRTVEDLWNVNQLARLISSTMPVNEILDKVVDISVKAVKAEQGTISLLDDENQEADRFKTIVRKIDVSQFKGKYRLDDHLSGWMVRNRKALTVNDVHSEKSLKGVTLDENIRSILSVPLLFKGKLIGVLNTFNKKEEGGFSNDDQRLLSIMAAQSAQVIENARLYEEEKRLRKYQQEMQMAREIQEGLLPAAVPETDSLEIASFFKPADEVGGDYFDYFPHGESDIALVMADVSGHGPSAALVMTMLKGVIRAISSEVETPERVLSDVNRIMEQIAPGETFVTMVFMLFDTKNKTLRFSNAGHPPLVRYDAATQKADLVELRGPAIGLSQRSVYQSERIQLHPGDLIFVYTDGVTEAFDAAGAMFDAQRLLTSVKESSSQPAGQMIGHIRDGISAFTGKTPQSDDIAMVAIKIK